MREIIRHLRWIQRHSKWALKRLLEMPHSETRAIAYQQIWNANRQATSTLNLLQR